MVCRQEPALSPHAFLGILAADTLYLEVGDSNRTAYASAGMKPFRPYADRLGIPQETREAAARQRPGKAPNLPRPRHQDAASASAERREVRVRGGGGTARQCAGPDTTAPRCA